MLLTLSDYVVIKSLHRPSANSSKKVIWSKWERREEESSRLLGQVKGRDKEIQWRTEFIRGQWVWKPAAMGTHPTPGEGSEILILEADELDVLIPHASNKHLIRLFSCYCESWRKGDTESTEAFNLQRHWRFFSDVHEIVQNLHKREWLLLEHISSGNLFWMIHPF